MAAKLAHLNSTVAQKCCDVARACVAIPVYNHARTVGDVVRGAREHASTVLVCDDGSTDDSAAEATRAGAVVFRLPSNRGKGVALATLFSEANARGFTHAVCLDADGQHLPGDLPRLIDAVLADPDALIVGSRDLVAARAPSSSQFGRKFSNFWVWFETGQVVEDSQCGFRAYPIPDVIALGATARRYDFETEVLLRAAWAGIPIRSVPVRVVYPVDRVTHFRLFVDNVRITLLNVLACLRMPIPWPLGPSLRPIPRRPGVSLFAIRRWAWLGAPGPLVRPLAALGGVLSFLEADSPWRFVPVLLSIVGGLGLLPLLAAWTAAAYLRRAGASIPTTVTGMVSAAIVFGLIEIAIARRSRSRQPLRWTGKSRGGVFGHWFFFTVLKVFGLGPAYLAVVPVALYFVFAAGAAREGSAGYLARVLGPAAFFERLRRAFRHFRTFAQTLVDRAAVGILGRAAFQFSEVGFEHMREAIAEGNGAILLTAHFGNWQLASMILDGVVSAPVSIVVFEGEEQAIRNIQSQVTGNQPKVISVNGQSLAMLEMFRALRSGELLAMQGDRCLGDEAVRIPFLGKDANWPPGPFRLAAASGAPVIATFSVKVGPRAYSLFADPPRRFSFDPDQPREPQLRAWMESYVRRLEALVREHPYQWFNFYDFWGDGPSRATDAARSDPPRTGPSPG